jgi:hypothetical protein
LQRLALRFDCDLLPAGFAADRRTFRLMIFPPLSLPRSDTITPT